MTNELSGEHNIIPHPDNIPNPDNVHYPDNIHYPDIIPYPDNIPLSRLYSLSSYKISLDSITIPIFMSQRGSKGYG